MHKFYKSQYDASVYLQQPDQAYKQSALHNVMKLVAEELIKLHAADGTIINYSDEAYYWKLQKIVVGWKKRCNYLWQNQIRCITMGVLVVENFF